jgi:hypothetical protein
VDFAGTAAALASYPVTDLTTQTSLLTKDTAGNTTVRQAGRLVVDVEYYKDIKPILQRSCVTCHSKSSPAAGLALDDSTLVDGYDNTYNRLANDSDAKWGPLPVIVNRQWRQTNASRYVRMFQSRRSLLVWKVFGQRLDGWKNSDHPTESTPGSAGTLPAGADPNSADLDYTGTIMPPPGSGVPALTEDEKMTIARWIDLGAPITQQGDPAYKGYFADEIEPVVALASPRAGANAGPLTSIRIGMFDAYSGIDRSSLSVTANFPVNGNAAGVELGAGFAQVDTSIWELKLAAPVASLGNGHVTVRVKDNAGNYTTVDRWFSVDGVTTPPSVTVSPASVTLLQSGTQQFSAGGAAVNWSISPVVGNIDANGLYTAPASVSAQTTVTVTAASAADPTVFGTAVVTLKPPPTFSISGVISPAAAGAGASVLLTGGLWRGATADASGAFTFAGLGNGAYTITPSKSGYTFSPASKTVNVNGGDVTGVTFGASATPTPAGGIAMDAKVWKDQGTASLTVVSPVFSTNHENELLLAFVATDYRSGPNTTVKSISGGGLTWTLAGRANSQSGTSEIWRAFATKRLTNVAVTATLPQSVVSSLTVLSFTGADPTGIVGAVGLRSAPSGAPTASLVTTRNNSWVFGVGNDYDQPIPRTPAAGQSIVHQFLSPTGDTYWVQMRNAPTPTKGTAVTINDSAPTSDRYNLVIVEIVP